MIKYGRIMAMAAHCFVVLRYLGLLGILNSIVSFAGKYIGGVL